MNIRTSVMESANWAWEMMIKVMFGWHLRMVRFDVIAFKLDSYGVRFIPAQLSRDLNASGVCTDRKN